jgi:hypothetical protein
MSYLLIPNVYLRELIYISFTEDAENIRDLLLDRRPSALARFVRCCEVTSAGSSLFIRVFQISTLYGLFE